MIKEAVRKGDLIKVPTMLDLYSPKFKLPLSKLAFDAQGELVPKYRHQNENLKNSETITTSELNTYKIVNAESIVLSESSVADLENILNKA